MAPALRSLAREAIYVEPESRTGAEMKRKRALQLQEEWGDKPCPHPAFAKEYDQGVRTGNFICTQCGAILGFREKGELMASRRAAEPPPES